eukprot:GILJ01011281.1.p1 GENE.GILJ01011281.1~~GILJ01011281.1.p1  ORF type:complete len:535 (-),score=74.59 GILJ01011281.1:48-1652(-)
MAESVSANGNTMGDTVVIHSSSVESPARFTSDSTCADILACFEEAVALKSRQSNILYTASVPSIPPGEYDVQFKIAARNTNRNEGAQQEHFVAQQHGHPPSSSGPANDPAHTPPSTPSQEHTTEQNAAPSIQPCASLPSPSQAEGMNVSVPPVSAGSLDALPFDVTFTQAEMPEPTSGTRSKLPAHMLAMFGTKLQSLGSMLQARSSGLYMMRFSPEIQAGLDSGKYTLNKNALGQTVSVGDGTKIVGSGGLQPVAVGSRIASAAGGMLSFGLQLYYMAAIHSAIQQQTKAIDRLNEHRLHAEFGKMMTVNQELTEVHEDLVAGRDVNAIASRLDMLGQKISKALNTLLCTLDTFVERARNVLQEYEESAGKLWITNFTALAEDFDGYRPSFDMLFEYVKCNIFVQCLKFAVAGSTALLENATQRVDAAVEMGLQMKEKFAVCDELLAVFAKFNWQPENRLLKPAAALYRGCHTLSGNLPKLEKASDTMKLWHEDVFSRHDAMMDCLLKKKKKVLVQWNANADSDSERLQILLP